jgi:hypothetical protein
MMSFRKLAMAAVLSVALSSAPVMAQQTQSAPIASLDRLSAELEEANAQDGGFPFLIVFVVVAVGLGIYAATSADDEPTSP